MKRLVKLLTVCLLAVVMVCGLFGCAPDGTPSGEKGLKFEKRHNENFYTVSGYVDDGSTTLSIPAEVEGVAVGRIGTNAFKNNGTLTSIVVPTSVTEIEAGAFTGIKALKEITLPFIGMNANSDAYYGETAGSEGEENEKATDIERHFAYIFGTDEYTYGSQITATYSAGGTASYYLPHGLSKVILNSDSAYSIPMYAFAGVTTVREIVLPATIDAIGEGAFSNCANLTKVNVPANVEKIYDSAFSGCARLVNGGIVFDDLTSTCALTTIGSKAFYATKLTEITLPASVTTIGEQCFATSSLRSIVLPANLTEIGFYAFYECKYLTLVDISAVTGTVVVKNAAFMNCERLDATTLKASAKLDVTGSANVFEGTLA